MDATAQGHAWSYMRRRVDFTIMFDNGSGVDDGVGADMSASSNTRPRHDHNAATEHCAR